MNILKKKGIKMRATFTLFVSLSLAACASVTHVVATGPDTYMVASHGTMGWSSGPAQKAKAFQETDHYRKGIRKQLQPIDSSETEGQFGKIAAGEVLFLVRGTGSLIG